MPSNKITIATLNIKELNNRNKQKESFTLLKTYKIDLLYHIIENKSKKEKEKENTLKV
ncbi:12036_t:CDS:1, partial [Gigaspora rosea]